MLNTDWVELWTEIKNPAASSAEFLSVTGTLNTVHKQVGKPVFDVTSGMPLWGFFICSKGIE